MSLIIAGPVNAQAPPAIGLIQALIRAAYAELDNAPFPLSISMEGRYDQNWLQLGTCQIAVRKVGANAGTDDRLLAGWFLYDAEEGLIREAVLSGSYLHTKPRHEWESAINEATRPEDVFASGLARLKARYGPDRRAEFIRNLQRERFEEVIGTIQKSDLEFQWRIPAERGGGFITPGWYLRVETMSSRGVRLCYSFFFEPVDGRLAGVVGGRCE